MKVAFLTIENNRIEATLNENGNKILVPLYTIADYRKMIREYDLYMVQCSSSLDFPEEYTDNENTINLCDQIRG